MNLHSIGKDNNNFKLTGYSFQLYFQQIKFVIKILSTPYLNDTLLHL